MAQSNGNGAMPVLALEMDRIGQVRKKMLRFDRDGQLENTLIQALYPGIRVATIDIPQEPLDAFEQAQVEQSLAKLECDGLRYALIGASASAKSRRGRPRASYRGALPVLAGSGYDVLRDPGLTLPGADRASGGSRSGR